MFTNDPDLRAEASPFIPSLPWQLSAESLSPAPPSSASPADPAAQRIWAERVRRWPARVARPPDRRIKTRQGGKGPTGQSSWCYRRQPPPWGFGSSAVLHVTLSPAGSAAAFEWHVRCSWSHLPPVRWHQTSCLSRMNVQTTFRQQRAPFPKARASHRSPEFYGWAETATGTSHPCRSASPCQQALSWLLRYWRSPPSGSLLPWRPHHWCHHHPWVTGETVRG